MEPFFYSLLLVVYESSVIRFVITRTYVLVQPLNNFKLTFLTVKLLGKDTSVENIGAQWFI